MRPPFSAVSLVLGLVTASICELTHAQEPPLPGGRTELLREPARVSYFVEGGASVFNNNTGFIRSQAGNVGLAYQMGRFHLGASTGLNFWRAPLFVVEGYEHIGVWNVGPFVEYRLAGGRARSALGAGVSLVVNPSFVDERPGALGFYADVRPLGLRFPVRRFWALGLDPLSAAIRVPDPRAIPLVEIQFMTWLRWEIQP